MVIFAIIGVVLTFSMVTFANRNADVDRLRVQLEADKMCGLAKNSINQAFANGPGTRTEFELPDSLFGLDYNMTLYAEDRKIILVWEDKVSICGILTRNVTNSTDKVFDFNKGKNQFLNKGGVIVVSSG